MSFDQHDRSLSGLWCHQVLEQLSRYLDHELAAGDRALFERHVLECDVCSRFGGEFAAAVDALRVSLQSEDRLPSEKRRTLLASLEGQGDW